MKQNNLCQAEQVVLLSESRIHRPPAWGLAATSRSELFRTWFSLGLVTTLNNFAGPDPVLFVLFSACPGSVQSEVSEELTTLVCESLFKMIPIAVDKNSFSIFSSVRKLGKIGTKIRDNKKLSKSCMQALTYGGQHKTIEKNACRDAI